MEISKENQYSKLWIERWRQQGICMDTKENGKFSFMAGLFILKLLESLPGEHDQLFH